MFSSIGPSFGSNLLLLSNVVAPQILEPLWKIPMFPFGSMETADIWPNLKSLFQSACHTISVYRENRLVHVMGQITYCKAWYFCLLLSIEFEDSISESVVIFGTRPLWYAGISSHCEVRDPLSLSSLSVSSEYSLIANFSSGKCILAFSTALCCKRKYAYVNRAVKTEISTSKSKVDQAIGSTLLVS